MTEQAASSGFPARRPLPKRDGVKTLEKPAKRAPKNPDEPISEKLQGFKERAAREKERFEFATQWAYFLNFCFMDAEEQCRFAIKFGFGDGTVYWFEDIEQYMAGIVDAKPRKRIPPKIMQYLYDELPEVVHQINYEEVTRSYIDGDELAMPVHQILRKFWDNWDEALKEPRQTVRRGPKDRADAGWFFTVVFPTEKKRNDWMIRHRLGHMVNRVSRTHIGPHLDGDYVTKLWTEDPSRPVTKAQDPGAAIEP